MPGSYLGFFVYGGKLGFRKISDQYSYKKQPSKIRHYRGVARGGGGPGGPVTPPW